MMRDCINHYCGYGSGVKGQWIYCIIMGLLRLVIVAMTVILERKVLRGLQLRTRPIVVGWWRVLQTIVDRVKLLTKRVIGGKVVLCSGVFLMVRCGLNVHYGVR